MIRTEKELKALKIQRNKISRLFDKRVAASETNFKPVQRGRIQAGYNLGDDMDRLLSWLVTVENTYKWRGAEYFPGEAYAREITAQETARDIRKEIENTQSIVDRIPERYWTEKKFTDLEHYTIITHKAEKPAWKGPLYYRLQGILGNVQLQIDKLVQLDYEDGYGKADETTAEWTKVYNQIMNTIRKYQSELKQAYYSPAQLENEQQQQKKYHVTIGQQAPQKFHINTDLFKNAQNNAGDDLDDLPFE